MRGRAADSPATVFIALVTPVLVATLALAFTPPCASALEEGAAASDSTAGSTYVQGRGLSLFKDPNGEVNFKLLTYFRYLNQNALDKQYTSPLGVPRTVDQRHDFQLVKVSINFFGWFLDPKFRYLGYVWSSNTSQGQLAQVVVAGNLSYRFGPALTLGGGIGGLPTTRSTEGTWPNWLPVDNRLVADEFFRGSYTSGMWAKGNLPRNLEYSVMVGNNLSQLGIDAAQLDNKISTWAGYLAWMPTTGEFGVANGFGDLEVHDEPATRFGVHGTYSAENRQSQPNTDAIENSQIRVSDGRIVFTPFAFGPDIAITDVDFKMIAADAGWKYRGWSLEGEYYWRLVDQLRGQNVDQLPFDKFSDTGFQLLASATPRPQALQLYAGFSQVFGEFGDPWEVRGGVNAFPWKNKAMRWNNEFIWLDHSPTGNAGYPYPVNAHGLVFSSNFEVNF